MEGVSIHQWTVLIDSYLHLLPKSEDDEGRCLRACGAFSLVCKVLSTCRRLCKLIAVEFKLDICIHLAREAFSGKGGDSGPGNVLRVRVSRQSRG